MIWNGLQGEFNLNNMEGKLFCRPFHQSLNSFLRFIFSLFLLKNNGFLFHASSLIRNGKGYIFPGKSGSGKTTIAKLSDDSTILTDELSLVRLMDGDYYIFGTPFSGELEVFGENTKALLSGVYFPIKDKENYIKEVSKAKSLQMLLPNVGFKGSYDKYLNEEIFNIVYEFTMSLNAYELPFLPEPSFWRSIDAR